MTTEERQPDKRVLRFLQFYDGRYQGVSEDKIASNLGFESRRALYQRLHEDGFPVCPRCGQMFVEAAHCQSSEDKRRRKARTGGEPFELPPPRAAKPLFRKALESLTRLVETRPKPLPKPYDFAEDQFIDEGLDTLREVRQGQLFVEALVEKPRPKGPGTYFRKYHSAEEWEELCEYFGVSPTTETILEEELAFSPGGVSDTLPICSSPS